MRRGTIPICERCWLEHQSERIEYYEKVLLKVLMPNVSHSPQVERCGLCSRVTILGAYVLRRSVMHDQCNACPERGIVMLDNRWWCAEHIDHGVRRALQTETSEDNKHE